MATTRPSEGKDDELQDMLELEHVIGYTGKYKSTLSCHPQQPTVCVFGLGSNILIQDLQDPHQQEFLYGHDEEISAVSISPKGTLIASGQVGSSKLANRDAAIIIWDYANLFDVFCLHGVRIGVKCLEFSWDEKFLAAAGEDNSLIIFDVQTGERLFVSQCSNPCTTVHWEAKSSSTQGAVRSRSNGGQPEYRLYVSEGPKIVCFRLTYSVGNMQYQVAKEYLRMAPGMIRTYDTSCTADNGGTIIFGTSVGDMSFYSVENQIYKGSMSICSAGVKSLATSRIDDQTFVGGGDGTLKRLDCTLSKVVDEIRLQGAVTSISLAADGSFLLAGTDAGKIYKINPNEAVNSDLSQSDERMMEYQIGRCSSRATMRVTNMIQGEVSPLVAVAFHPKDSLRFATLTTSGIVRVWDLTDYNLLASNQEHQRTAGGIDYGNCLAFDEFEQQLVTGWKSGFVRAYDSSTGDKLWELSQAHKEGVSAVCTTQLYYATGGSTGGVRLWSRSSRTQLIGFQDHFAKPVVGLVPDCCQPHLLHSCGEDRCIYTYDLKQEKRVVSHQISSGGTFSSITQRLDSEFELITATTNGQLMTWDYDVPEHVQCVDDDGSLHFTCVRVSPTTGRYLAASNTEMLVKVWDLKTGQIISVGRGHSGPVNFLAWSPDEKQLVSVGEDQCICVWNFYGEDNISAEGKHD